MILLDPEIICILAGIVLALTLWRYAKTGDLMDWGMCIPYAVLFVVYLAFAIYPNLPIEVTRLWGRTSVGILLITKATYTAACIWANRMIKHGKYQ